MPGEVEARETLDPLGLELQAVVSHLMWTLQIKLQQSTRAKITLNCWATSPDPMIGISDWIICHPGGEHI